MSNQKYSSFFNSALVYVVTLAMVFGILPPSRIIANSEPVMTPKIGAERNTGQPLSEILDESGRIKPNSKGSFDPRGFRMVEGEDGVPRFLPETSSGDMPDEPSSVATCSDNWDTRFGIPSGVSSEVRAITISGSNMYIGGLFTSVSGLQASRIAKWDGSSWSSLGSGVVLTTSPTDTSVDWIKVVGTDVYVAGQFNSAGGSTANNVAKWSTVTNTWTNLSTGTNGRIYAMEVLGGVVYVGGAFTLAGGISARRIAKWDTSSSTWSTVGNGTEITGSAVWAISAVGNNLYVGGSFTDAIGSNITKWDGTTWSPLGTGVDSTVYAIAGSGSDVYVGGIFTIAGGISANRIAKWNESTSTWSALSTGTNSTVHSIAFMGTDVIITGTFITVGGVSRSRIARWNGTSWSSLGSGLDAVRDSASPSLAGKALAVSGSNLFLGGVFGKAGGNTAVNLAKWNGTDWKPISSRDVSGFGVSGNVRAIALDGNDIYIGGDFLYVGETAATRVAKWDGRSWSALGNGLDARVARLEVMGGQLYAGGLFTGSGTGGSRVNANKLAVWNGTAWAAVGGSITSSGEVHSMKASGSNLYVGGNFSEMGGVAGTFSIAKWDGSAWSPLGGGLRSNDATAGLVYDIDADGNDVYFVGAFTKAHASTADSNPLSVGRVAWWNGSVWNTLGTGFNSSLTYQIEFVSPTEIYAGGGFTMASDAPANRIARWNGASWVPLGSGLNDEVFSLEMVGTELYVGGKFTNQGSFLAKWNPAFETWSSLSADGWVLELFSTSSGVYAGGFFNNLGCTPSLRFGRMILTSFNGTFDNSFEHPFNWSPIGGTNPTSDVVISGANATLSTDTTVNDLQVNRGRTLTITAGTTLTVNGSLIVDGDIAGDGEVYVTSPIPNAGVRTGPGWVRASVLRDIMSDTRAFLFPVGTVNGYAPISLSNNLGAETISVKAYQGAYADPAAGINLNMIPRWWDISVVTFLMPPPPDLKAKATTDKAKSDSPGGLQTLITDITFGYLAGEITLGNPATYKAWRISGGVATNKGGTNFTDENRLTVMGISEFSDWTLAAGRSTAAPGVIAGRVLDSNGRPVANASVLLTKSDGETVTVKTNNFGRYRFTGIVAGETYVVMAQTRWNLYMPQVVTLSGDLADLDFRP